MTGNLRPYPEYKDAGMAACGAAPSDQLYYDSIFERRDRYFVEYRPPLIGGLFATLNLVFPTDVDKHVVVAAMEREATHWLHRHALPLMVTACDKTDTVIPLEPIRPCDHLLARMDDGAATTAWRLLPDSEFTDGPITGDTLKRVYPDVGYRSQAEVTANAVANLRKMRLASAYLSIVLIFGLVVVPAAIAILGWASPLWGFAILVYALARAATAGLKLLGYVKPSARELQRREKERETRHFHYHCKRNPQGFARLKGENFEEDARADIRRQAKSLGMSAAAPMSTQEEAGP